MPARASSKRALAARFRGRSAGSSINRPSPADVRDEPPSDPFSDTDLDIIGDRIATIILNDEGPNMKTGFNPEPPCHVDVQNPPNDIKAEHVLPEIQNI